MTVQYSYIIDTSSLVQLKRTNPMDIFPGVWSNLEKLATAGLLYCPEEVLREVTNRDDELKEWAHRNKVMFRRLTESQMSKVVEIETKYPSLVDPEKETPVADPFVIALALQPNRQTTIVPVERKIIVVTEERLKGNKVCIPFVCLNYGVEYINLFELFRREGWKF
jgi:hypothetical protein